MRSGSEPATATGRTPDDLLAKLRTSLEHQGYKSARSKQPFSGRGALNLVFDPTGWQTS